MSLTKLERRTRKPLTTTQRKALNQAKAKGGAKLGTDKGEIRARVANVLLELGWVTIVEGTVLISKAGRAKLNEPLPEDPPVYLARGGSVKYRVDRDTNRWVVDEDAADTFTDHGYTTVRGRASDDLEVWDDTLLHPEWRLAAERRHEGARDARVRSRGLARSLREAA